MAPQGLLAYSTASAVSATIGSPTPAVSAAAALTIVPPSEGLRALLAALPGASGARVPSALERRLFRAASWKREAVLAFFQLSLAVALPGLAASLSAGHLRHGRRGRNACGMRV